MATPVLSAAIVNHSRVFYVTERQKQIYELLLTLMKFGVPGIMLTALLLHYVVGVKIFERPSLR